jgi:hypothetical protein
VLVMKFLLGNVRGELCGLVFTSLIMRTTMGYTCMAPDSYTNGRGGNMLVPRTQGNREHVCFSGVACIAGLASLLQSMLNNGGQSQNDAYPGIQAYQQYGQNMASTLNAPPAGYGGQQKRVAMQQGLQPGIQPSMAGTRQPAQRSNVARFPATQYPANRGLPHQAGLTSPSVTSSIAPIRQGHSQFATNSGMQVRFIALACICTNALHSPASFVHSCKLG